MVKKYLFSLLLFLSLLNACDKAINIEFANMIRSGNFDITKLDRFAKSCENNARFYVAKYLTLADRYTDTNCTKALNYYNLAFNIIKEKNVTEFNALKQYLENSYNRCAIQENRVISSNELTRSYIVKRDAILTPTSTLGIPLNFKTNSSKIEKGVNLKQAQEIKKALLSSKFNGMTINIMGYTDTRGSAEYNLKLSKERAEALKAFILKNAQREINIVIDEKGERYPICITGKAVEKSNREWQCTGLEDLARSRRVEITYH